MRSWPARPAAQGSKSCLRSVVREIVISRGPTNGEHSSREKALVAFLCHELGHWELNLFSGMNDSIAPPSPMFEPEDIDANKAQEFKADAYMQ